MKDDILKTFIKQEEAEPGNRGMATPGKPKAMLIADSNREYIKKTPGHD